MERGGTDKDFMEKRGEGEKRVLIEGELKVIRYIFVMKKKLCSSSDNI